MEVEAFAVAPVYGFWDGLGRKASGMGSDLGWFLHSAVVEQHTCCWMPGNSDPRVDSESSVPPGLEDGECEDSDLVEDESFVLFSRVVWLVVLTE